MVVRLRTIACLITFGVSVPAFADPLSYTVDSSHTFPTYEISHVGFSTQRGRFNKVQGKIIFDRVAKSGMVDIAIDTNSIDTGFAKLEEHLRSEDFFNVEKYPTMTFKSNNIKFNGDQPIAA